jgi:hypothetical protein
MLANSAVLLNATILYYLLALLAIPDKIGLWKTFLKIDSDSKKEGFTNVMQV